MQSLLLRLKAEPSHCAAGSDREPNFGFTGEAAPNPASSRVARYS
jgi:hypothetical protein